MSDKSHSKRTVSAMMDSELDADEMRFTLRRISHDQSLAEVWQNYHLIKDVMRGDFDGMAQTDFSNPIMASIYAEKAQAEAQDTSPNNGTRLSKYRTWWRWTAGGAIAASVAVAALVVMRPDVGAVDDQSAQQALASLEQDVSQTSDGDGSALDMHKVIVDASPEFQQWQPSHQVFADGPLALPAAASSSGVPSSFSRPFLKTNYLPMSPVSFDINQAANQAVIESSSRSYEDAIKSGQH